MPLSGLVLHLLHPRLEHVLAPITPGCKLCIIASSAVDPVSLGSELFVHETGSALVAEEASLVPVLLLVAQILGVDTDDLAALVTVVGEHILITLDAVGMIVPQNISAK